MKSLFTALVLAFIFFHTVQAQTFISGGIYSNTTWTLANSPYIVMDTTVVFPGVTLTIEPGVVIKFADGKYMEVRQAHLVALGTASDSILITSNSATPSAGIYYGIVFTNAVSIAFDYCIFKYANTSIGIAQTTNMTITIDHSTFSDNNNCINQANCSFYIAHTSFYNNGNCLGDIGLGVRNCILDSCIFRNNQFGAHIDQDGNATNCLFDNNGYGLYIMDQGSYTVENCIFCNNVNGLISFPHTSHRLIHSNFSQNHHAIQGHLTYMEGNILTNNDTALSQSLFGSSDTIFQNYIYHNQVGLLTGGGMSPTFYSNYICNNGYNINYTSSNNGSISPICFCDTDSVSIRSTIYDGYVNVSRGLLNFSPFIHCDSAALNAIPPLNCQTVVIVTGIGENTFQSYLQIRILPNPASDLIDIYFEEPISKGTIIIFNLLGELKYSSVFRGAESKIDISSLANGIYILEARDGNKIMRQKFVKENIR